MIRESNDGLDWTGRAAAAERAELAAEMEEEAPSGRMEREGVAVQQFVSSELKLLFPARQTSSKALPQPVRGEPQQFVLSDLKPRRRVSAFPLQLTAVLKLHL
jgi:hypothetical protein